MADIYTDRMNLPTPAAPPATPPTTPGLDPESDGIPDLDAVYPADCGPGLVRCHPDWPCERHVDFWLHHRTEERASKDRERPKNSETRLMDEQGIPSGGKEGVSGRGMSAGEPYPDARRTDSLAVPALPTFRCWVKRNRHLLAFWFGVAEVVLIWVLVVLEWVRR